MAGQAPIDPLTAMHALIAAWNRGQEAGAAPAASPHAAREDSGLAEIVERLARIEDVLLRIEALAAQGEARRAEKAERRHAKERRKGAR